MKTLPQPGKIFELRIERYMGDVHTGVVTHIEDAITVKLIRKHPDHEDIWLMEDIYKKYYTSPAYFYESSLIIEV